jgi:acetyl/propionyl-CoA carboxylase alpha subunit
MLLLVRIANRFDVEVELGAQSEAPILLDGGCVVRVEDGSTGGVLYLELEGGRPAFCVFNGVRFPIAVLTERERLIEQSLKSAGAHAVHASFEVRAQMPGLLRMLDVAVGDAVEAGGRIGILEAMKMENEIRSPIAGIVQTISVTEGIPLEKGQIIATIA